MQVTLGQIVDAEAAVGRLLLERLPITHLYWVAELGGLLREKIRAYRQMEFALIMRYGAAQPNGEYMIAPGMPAFEPFKAEADALRATEVALAWTPMDSVAFGAVHSTGEDMLALRPFITLARPAGGAA